jgi:murein DD-endopeptidase MepM/ murein hydrolase activator NlpD
MFNYRVGSLLRLHRRRSQVADVSRIQVNPGSAELASVGSPTPHRSRALLRHASLKLKDVRFLARYIVHAVVLLLMLGLGAIQSLDLAGTLGSRPAFAQGPATITPTFYTVQPGDNPATIAAQFGLQPTTVVWAHNYVGTNPELLMVGEQLVLPPVDGILHTVVDGDTPENLARKYHIDVGAMVGYPGNNLQDQWTPIHIGQILMVPGGVLPETPVADEVVTAEAVGSSSSGTSTSAPRASTTSSTAASTARPATSSAATTTNSSATTSSSNRYVGATGCCRWPVRGRITQQPWSRHMALDIAAPTGTPVVAADGGRVTASGWHNGGYGYRVVIDHGNGLSTLYAHFSYINVRTGAYVNKGALIGRIGSTGRSTGPHLHFEVRRNGRLVNPWGYLQ